MAKSGYRKQGLDAVQVVKRGESKGKGLTYRLGGRPTKFTRESLAEKISEYFESGAS